MIKTYSSTIEKVWNIEIVNNLHMQVTFIVPTNPRECARDRKQTVEVERIFGNSVDQANAMAYNPFHYEKKNVTPLGSTKCTVKTHGGPRKLFRISVFHELDRN